MWLAFPKILAEEFPYPAAALCNSDRELQTCAYPDSFARFWHGPYSGMPPVIHPQ